ncbi:hypothetical protein [Hydrogenophilus thermoluteolus]|uniref:Uncharacterized protein n=1 Tax=Hydrogenophilus thermoluteolus TaxID=297 RepID=A0A2Z6DW99_HYDTE|nr:hypothetical protein [Hydrogenophilus thermoluteolus]BBD76619.1 hypothetical protein HPTL_0351 [Hydrogenophilus thermoluteolus]
MEHPTERAPETVHAASEVIFFPPPTQTFALLFGAHALVAGVAFTSLVGKALALAAVALALSALGTAWRWQKHRCAGYLLEGDRLRRVRRPTGPHGATLTTQFADNTARLVALQRVGLWWRLTARTVKGAHFTIWIEWWRLSAADDWRLAVRAHGWIGDAAQPLA